MSVLPLIDHLTQQGVELWFEGNRLRFRGPPGALSPEQRTELSGRRDEVIEALRQRAANQTQVVPLSYGQRSLWFVHQERPTSAAYHVAFAVTVTSTVNRDGLRQALQALVDRHAILRTTYGFVDGHLSQRIAGIGVAPVDFFDVPGLTDEDLRVRVAADYQRPFDLELGPVWRTALYSRGLEDHVLLLTAHHVAVDGWSLLLLLDEFRQLYLEQNGEKAPALPRPEPRYTEYAAWQTRMLASQEGDELAKYWEQKLAAPRTELEIPPDRPRPPRKSGSGATFDFRVDAEDVTRLSQLARAEGATLFVLALAAFKVLLHRYTGVEDIVVGTPTLGRNKGEFSRTVGHFVNPVPVRSTVAAGAPFRALMNDVRHTLLEALDRQEYPLPLIVERLHPVRDPSRSPLFETIFVLQRFDQFRDLNELVVPGSAQLTDFGGLRARPFPLLQQEGQFDLAVGLSERDGALTGAVKYNPDLFDRSTIARLAGHYVNLLRSIVANPGATVGQLALLTPGERDALLSPPAPTSRSLGAAPLHERFEAQVERTPNAIAATCDDQRLSYADLNGRANQLAHRLRKSGIGPDSLVGIAVERSLDLIVGILGILKAGGAYVPIDLAYPADRIAFMLADAKATVLVTQRDLVEKLPAHQGETVCLDDESLAGFPATNPPRVATADNLIYVIYTSGSTGNPKGTLLTHQAVDRLLQATDPWYGFGPADVWTMFHSAAFDFSVWELWGALVYGGRLVVVPFWVSRSPEKFLELIRREGVTVLNQTPSAFRQLIQAEIAGGARGKTALRYVIFGGEALELQSLRPWFDRFGDETPRLVNMYGITETCVHVTYRPIRAADLDAGKGSVIGVPIPDLAVYVLDPAREPVPLGVVGELYVGGPGLARGYLNRPEMTADRFIPDPFHPGQTLYRTGDLARRLADGDIEYIGRIDQQVKIRGFRIELGEIESALSGHPQVRQAAVIARDGPSGSKQLVAYVVFDGSDQLDPSILREHLRRTLPDYMVPAHFVPLPTLPLTANNKVDVKALPAPETAMVARDDEDNQPRNALEMQLLVLWRQALGNEKLGIHDNFFDQGGHSLVAAELLSQVEHVFGRKLPLATLFQAPAVAQLAAILGGQDWTATWRSLVAINPIGTSVPLFLVPGVGGNVLTFGRLATLLGSDQPVYGLQARGLDGKEEPLRSVGEMAAHYVNEIQAIRPRGPYFIGGTCTGGVIAFEIAQRLAAVGEDVRLTILETWPPASVRLHPMSRRRLSPARYYGNKLMGYGRELAHLPIRDWPAFVRKKIQAGRAVFEAPLNDRPEGGSYHVEKVVHATLQAVARYEPAAYPGSLLNVIAINRPLPAEAVDTRRMWESLALGGAKTILVPAEDSGRLFVSPHVEVVAELLRQHAETEFSAPAEA